MSTFRILVTFKLKVRFFTLFLTLVSSKRNRWFQNMWRDSNEMCVYRWGKMLLSLILLYSTYLHSFTLSRSFGTFSFYEFVISVANARSIKASNAMYFNGLRLPRTNNSRCVLMSFLSSPLLFSYVHFYLFRWNNSDAMSIEFEMRPSAISICTCVSYDKLEFPPATHWIRTNGNLLNFVYLFRFVISASFPGGLNDWISEHIYPPHIGSIGYVYIFFYGEYFWKPKILFSHYTEIDWLLHFHNADTLL